MRLQFSLGILFGILLGGMAGWGLQSYLERKLLPPLGPSATEKLLQPEPTPEQASTWLMPKDFSVTGLFPDKRALKCILEPEAVTEYLADKKGTMKLSDYRFSSEGISIERSNLQFLKQMWEAPNAYRPITMCAFNPGVLLKFKNRTDEVKTMICFSCNDMRWMLNETEEISGGAGLTEYALKPLKAVLHQAFPDNPVFLQNPILPRK